MINMPIRRGVCDICGEHDVDLMRSDSLPEEFEGVGCGNCCSYHAREREQQDFIDEKRRAEKREEAIDDWGMHGD